MRVQEGPIDPPRNIEDVRQEPYSLPDRCGAMCCSLLLHALHCAHACAKVPAYADVPLSNLPLWVWRSFVWSTCDVNDDKIVKEVICPSLCDASLLYLQFLFSRRQQWLTLVVDKHDIALSVLPILYFVVSGVPVADAQLCGG